MTKWTDKRGDECHTHHLCRTWLREETVVGVLFYEPGNGTRYEMMYGHTPYIHDPDSPIQFFATWMKNNGSGGVTVKHSANSYCHWSYVKEKMELHSHEDAKAIAHFINTMNYKNYKPDTETLPRGLREELEREEAQCQNGN